MYEEKPGRTFSADETGLQIMVCTTATAQAVPYFVGMRGVRQRDA
jgi:hypothetical protein